MPGTALACTQMNSPKMMVENKGQTEVHRTTQNLTYMNNKLKTG